MSSVQIFNNSKSDKKEEQRSKTFTIEKLSVPVHLKEVIEKETCPDIIFKQIEYC